MKRNIYINSILTLCTSLFLLSCTKSVTEKPTDTGTTNVVVKDPSVIGQWKLISSIQAGGFVGAGAGVASSAPDTGFVTTTMLILNADSTFSKYKETTNIATGTISDLVLSEGVFAVANKVITWNKKSGPISSIGTIPPIGNLSWSGNDTLKINTSYPGNVLIEESYVRK